MPVRSLMFISYTSILLMEGGLIFLAYFAVLLDQAATFATVVAAPNISVIVLCAIRRLLLQQ